MKAEDFLRRRLAELEREEAVQRPVSPPPAPPAQPRSDSAEEYLKRKLKELGRYDERTNEFDYQVSQAKKGLAGFGSLFALPLDAIGTTLYNYAISPLGRALGARSLQPVDPFFYTNLTRRAIEGALGAQDIKPSDPGMEWRGKVVEFGAAGLPVSVLNVARAVQAAPTAGRAIYPAIKALAQEGLQTVGAATGAHIGSHAGWGPAGEAGAALAGGLLGLKLSSLADSADTAIGGVISGAKAHLAGDAPREISRAFKKDPKAYENVARSIEVQRELERLGGVGYNPMLGARSGATALLERERKIAGSSPEALDRAVQAQQRTQEAIARAADTAIGQRQLSPSEIQRQLRAHRDAAMAAIKQRGGALDEAQGEISRRFQPSPQQQLGERIYERFGKALQAAQKQRDELYEVAYKLADQEGLKIDASDIVARLKEIRAADENAFQNVPMLGRILGRWAPKEETQLVSATGQPIRDPSRISLQELHSLLKEVNKELGQAMRSQSTSAPYQQYYLNQIKGLLDEKLRRVEEAGGIAAEALKKANQWYATQYAPRFREGLGGMMRARGPYTEKILPSDIVQKAISRPEYLDDYKRIFAGDSEAMQALRDGIIDRFARETKVDATGVLKPEEVRKFLAKYDEQLAKLPELRKELSDAATALDRIVEARARMFERAKMMDRSAAAAIVGSSDPIEAIGKMLVERDRKALTELLAIPNERLRTTLARTILDSIPEAAAKKGVSPYDFVRANEDILRPIFNRVGPDHYKNVKLLMEAKSIADRTKLPAHAEIPERSDVFRETLGMPFNVLWNVGIRGRATGHTGTHGASVAIGTRVANFLRSKKADQMLERALYDPDLAQSLAEMARFKGDMGKFEQLMQRIERQGLSLGVRLTAADYGED